MRKALIIIGATLMATMVHAAPLELDLKFVKLVMPFMNVSTSYLYDIKFERSLIGVETPIVVGSKGKNRLLIGAAFPENTSQTDENTIAYIGADTEVSEKWFGDRFNLGAWGSWDYDEKEIIGGAKASIRLWGEP